MIGTKLWRAMLVVSLAGCTVEASSETEPGDAAEAAQELSRNALTPAQQSTALKLIDDICGDTWCEGDHDFRFDALVCQRGCAGRPGTCKLTFRLFSYDTDVETGPTFRRSCETPGFSGFDSLVRTQGSYQSLQPSYYDALTECISRVEAELPR